MCANLPCQVFSYFLIVDQELVWVMLFSEEEWSTEYEDFTGLTHVLFFQILATAPLYWEAKELHFSSSYNFINFFFFPQSLWNL